MSRINHLRDLVLALAVEQIKLGHLSIEHKISRSTLSTANNQRTPEVFESVYYSLLGRFRRFLRDSHLFEGVVKNLYAIDSSTITLYSNILKGTGKPNYVDGRRKGGMKVHTVMNVEEGVPHMVTLTKAAKSDVKLMDMACKLPKGSVITMDKAYSNHSIMHRLSGLGIWYVSRMKDNVNYVVIKSVPVENKEDSKGQVIKDEYVKVSVDKHRRHWHVCRRIEYIGTVKDRNGKEHEKLFVFITNNFKFDAHIVAGIYSNRWQIELLFKKIKQNFPLKYFYGESVNAIANQVWATLIACLLLTVIHREACSKRKWAFSNLASLVRIRPPPKNDLFTMAGIYE